MNYQKEYATLAGQVDRAVSLLDQCGESAAERVRKLLIAALRSAEERYIESE